MTATATAPAAEYVAAYGLKRPQVADARKAVDRVFGTDAPRVWDGIVAAAGGQGESSLDRIVAVMRDHADEVLRLCGSSLAIRLSSYTRLAATHAIVTA